tara:strand:- start:1111 stop:1668 length:558 start_codon:yes stop_codon:yes gene_type:complete
LSSNKSFSTETSERYGLALFEVANEFSEIEIIENNVKDLLEIYNSNKDLENFFKNPTQSLSNQLLVVKNISEKMKFSKIFKNFLSVLVTKRRIFFLKKIILSFLNLCSIRKGELSATLISSKKLSSDEINNISSDLSKTIGSKINFNYLIDQNLIGGLKIQLGSLMIDTSIKNKLQKYQKAMLEN